MSPGEYVRSLFPRPRDRVSLVAIPRGERGARVVQVIRSAEVAAAERTQAWLRHLNARRHDVFLGVNPVRPGAWGRTKASIGEVMRLFLDIDEDGDAALKRILGDVGGGALPPPTHVVRTSPGRYQVLWSLPRGELDHARAEALAGGLALRYGADLQVTDVARVLRIPGYRNWKRGGTPCSLMLSTGRQARIGEFPADLPARPAGASRAAPGRTRAVRTPGRGDTSPSGRDWAHTRQRLREGADPAALVAELAARRRDKPRPQAYAERTVRNAVASLKSGRRRAWRPGSRLPSKPH